MYRIFVQILENKSLFQILGWTGSYIEGAWRENFILTRFLVVEFYCITWQKSGLEVAAYAVALRLSDRQIFWLAVMKSWDRYSVKKMVIFTVQKRQGFQRVLCVSPKLAFLHNCIFNSKSAVLLFFHFNIYHNFNGITWKNWFGSFLQPR